MSRAEKLKRRCAIYTRKSTEEGLDQAFNSLDAQREACAAYILSQQHEGWTLVPDLYDDGGFSGGNLDRPGLVHLLADVKAGKIDVIVVYKVDRLTRSLADFAKIVDVLDAQGASFVSVTQAFNTTNSMGRLTLNVLLSFAQFEREVTGERIRDKIAASKARGMWMGGVVPLGYEVKDRKLVVVPDDAAMVEMIFRRYLALGSVLALADELEAQGIRSKSRMSRNGRAYGNTPFSRGALYLMLKNRIYLGKTVHKGKVYPGEHDAIVSRCLFDEVAALLGHNLLDHRNAVHAQDPSLLVGRVWDGEGRRMTPNHANKRGRRYRYYVSRKQLGEAEQPLSRVPAGDLEAIVLAQLHQALGARYDRTGIPPLFASSIHEQRRQVARYVERVDVQADQITILFSDEIDDGSQSISVPAKLVRRGKEMRISVPPSEQVRTERDPALIKLVVKAHMARAALALAGEKSIAEIAKEEGYSRDYFGVLLRIAYMAPDILTAIIGGRQPTQLNRQRLARATNLPIDWDAQRQMFGFA